MHRYYIVLVVCALIYAAPVEADNETTRFKAHWQDGRAEINSYRLKVLRYGHEGVGQAVMIYVSELFSQEKMVKSNRPAPNDDVIEVLKLNLVRDFQTGIYDYNTMTSVFVDTRDFTPLKTSFTSAEWCGHVYEDLGFRGSKVRGMIHSYFEDESKSIRLKRRRGGIPEDALFIILRGLGGDVLAPGESRTLPLVSSAFYRRLHHEEARWIDAEIERAHDSISIEVPAGTFETWRYEVRLGDDRRGSFWIEAAYPHRIIRWRLLPDVEGELLATERLRYWQLSAPGEENALQRLKLAPGAAVLPLRGPATNVTKR